MLEAVIFDWAGTLVDFGSRAPLSAFVALFEKHCVSITLAEAREPMGTEKQEHIRRLLRMPRLRALWRDVHGAEASETAIDQLYTDLIPIQRDAIARHAALVPGAAETCGVLREMKLKVGSTTGYGRAMVGPMLRLAAEQGLTLDCVVTSDEVPRARPGPAGALKNAIELAVSDVRQCVKVDDTEPGIAEGRSAGMWTVAVAVSGNAIGLGHDEWSLLPAQRQQELRDTAYAIAGAYGAHYVIDSVAELPRIVAEINQRLGRGEKP